MQAQTDLLFVWRRQVAGPSGPEPFGRLVLLTLALYMDRRGRCFPSVARLVEDTGLCKSTVIKYLRQAAREGWLRVEKLGRGPNWSRHQYQALMPGKQPHPVDPAEAASEPDRPAVHPVDRPAAERGLSRTPLRSIPAHAAVYPVDRNSSRNSSKNSSGGGPVESDDATGALPDASAPPPPPSKMFSGTEPPFTDQERDTVSRVLDTARRALGERYGLGALYARLTGRRPLGAEQTELAALEQTYDPAWLEAALAGAASKSRANVYSVRRWIDVWEKRRQERRSGPARVYPLRPDAHPLRPDARPSPKPPEPAPPAFTYADLERRLSPEDLRRLEQAAGAGLPPEFATAAAVRGEMVALYLRRQGASEAPSGRHMGRARPDPAAHRVIPAPEVDAHRVIPAP